MNIPDISSFYHDSAAALIANGYLRVAGQVEHFIRKKHDPAFPSNAIKYCLSYSGLSIDKLEAVLLNDKPFFKIGRLWEMYYEYVLRGLRSFIAAIPVWLNQKYVNYATGFSKGYDERWEKLFGFPRRDSESNLEQYHCDLRFAIQQLTEEIGIEMSQKAKKMTGAEYLFLAGGVTLNCVANGKLLNTKIFKDISIQLAAGDIGAAQTVYHIDFSTRFQTVYKETIQRYRTLIEEFRKRTGYGIVVNTSINVGGEQIVYTPKTYTYVL